MKKINKRKIVIVFFLFCSILIPSDIYWEPIKVNLNTPVIIYIDTSKDDNFKLSYPMYIHIIDSKNNDILTKMMILDFSKGPSIWHYKTYITENLSFTINDKRIHNPNDDIYNIELQSENQYDFQELSIYLENKDYTKTIKGLDNIIANNNRATIAAEAQYMIAEIYLNDFKNYEISADYLNEIIINYSDTLNVVKKSMFTLAYIYSNYLDNYSKAILLYNNFKRIYPDDELLESINYELKILSNIQSTIDSLLNIGK